MRLIKYFILFSSIICLTALSASAQDSRSGNPDAIFGEAPSPEKKSDVKAAKKRKKSNSFNKNLDKKVEETEKRLEDNIKRNRKRAKQMEKPQYSDPSYFGHKKKPKKRPPGKQKFCKECGIKH